MRELSKPRVYRSKINSLRSPRKKWQRPLETIRMIWAKQTFRYRRWLDDNRLSPGRWTTSASLLNPLATSEGSHSDALRTTARTAPSGNHPRSPMAASDPRFISAHNPATRSPLPTPRCLRRQLALKCICAHSTKRTCFRVKLSQSWDAKKGKRQLQRLEALEMSFDWTETQIWHNN